MLHMEPGSLADWVGNVISFLGILVASFFTVRYYCKDNRKTWKLYKNIELKRIFLEICIKNCYRREINETQKREFCNRQ